MQLEHIILVGHGKMGSAMLARWRNQSRATHFDIVSPNHKQTDSDNCAWHRDLSSVKQRTKNPVIIFAVKPAMLDSLLTQYAKHFSDNAPLYISVAAGKELAFYHEHLGSDATIIRAMPNTPSQIGQGMTILYAQAATDKTARDTAQQLMHILGASCWLDDESQMDAAMALSGCGPAYVYSFVESMINAGVKSGLSEQQAHELTVQTVKGSIALLEHTSRSPSELSAQVASPGGATQAALEQLTSPNGMPLLVMKAIDAAITRAKELAKNQ